MSNMKLVTELEEVYNLGCSSIKYINKLTQDCLDWIEQVKDDINLNDSKQLLMLPKTPMACKRATKKRRMSIINENGMAVDDEFIRPKTVTKPRKASKKIVSTGIRQSRRNTRQRSNASQYGLRNREVSASSVTAMEWQSISSLSVKTSPECAVARNTTASDIEWHFQEVDINTVEIKSPAMQVTRPALLASCDKAGASIDIGSRSLVPIQPLLDKLPEVSVNLGQKVDASLKTVSHESCNTHTKNAAMITTIGPQTQDKDTFSSEDEICFIKQTVKKKMKIVSLSPVNQNIISPLIVTPSNITLNSAHVINLPDSVNEIPLVVGIESAKSEYLKSNVLDLYTNDDDLPLSKINDTQLTNTVDVVNKNCEDNVLISCNKKLPNVVESASQASKAAVNGENDLLPKTGLVHVDHVPKSKLCKSPIIFSPYAGQPVKSRVAAYEKLKPVNEDVIAEVTKTPGPIVRMTRTKTKAIADAAAAAAQEPDYKSKRPKNLCNDSLKKLIFGLPVPHFSSQKNVEAYKTTSKENSILSISSKSGYNSASKNNSRNLQLSSKVLSELNTNSSQINRHVSVKSGSIVTNIDTFIKKVNTKTNLEAIEEKKQEDRKKREERAQDALKKRELIIKQRAEGQKRKREEKMMKVHQAHIASLKEKEENQRRLEKEKEEKLLHVNKEKEMKQKEELLKKKQRAQQKAVEIEERRKLEEAVRLAKLKEQEEEQRRNQAIRKKEQEDADRQNMKRLADKEMALVREKAAQSAKVQLKVYKPNHGKVEASDVESSLPLNATFDVLSTTYNVNTSQSQAPDTNVKNVNNYSISNVQSGESSDDEDKPKKCIPTWASKARRKAPAFMLDYLPRPLKVRFMSSAHCTLDLKLFFPKIDKQMLVRTSSAIWRSPPISGKK